MLQTGFQHWLTLQVCTNLVMITHKMFYFAAYQISRIFQDVKFGSLSSGILRAIISSQR